MDILKWIVLVIAVILIVPILLAVVLVVLTIGLSMTVIIGTMMVCALMVGYIGGTCSAVVDWFRRTAGVQ